MFLLTISVHTTLHLVTRAVSPKNSVRKISSATPSTRAGMLSNDHSGAGAKVL